MMAVAALIKVDSLPQYTHVAKDGIKGTTQRNRPSQFRKVLKMNEMQKVVILLMKALKPKNRIIPVASKKAKYRSSVPIPTAVLQYKLVRVKSIVVKPLEMTAYVQKT